MIKDGSQDPMESAHIKWAQFGSYVDYAFIQYICKGYTFGISKWVIKVIFSSLLLFSRAFYAVTAVILMCGIEGWPPLAISFNISLNFGPILML